MPPFFSVLRLWHRYAICILTRVQKGRIYSWKQGNILLINVLLKINFEHEGHFYANCLFCIFSSFIKCFFFSILKWWHRHDDHLYSYCLLYIFTFCCKCPLFQFLGYGISMKWINSWTNGDNLLKNILFQLNFQDEGKLYANYLYYILSF